MGKEIERKFLLKHAGWRAQIRATEQMRQGYLQSNLLSSVRVRISGEHAFLNIKSATLDVSRLEFEYAIPVADATEILDALCEKPLIEKRRHEVPVGNHLWEIDEFEGDNAGLIVAEIELQRADEIFERPDWLGEEVSHDPRYYNVCLVKHPYSQWRHPAVDKRE
jgi:adenylate cyclase